MMHAASNTNCTSSTNKNPDFYISFFNISLKQFRNIFVNKKYCRKLAKILGSLDCVEFFKEIYFFCTAKSGGILVDGQRYIYNSFKAWQNQLDDIRCDRTLQNYAKKLLEVGLIKIERLRKHEFNHTNYYSVNFEKLFELIEFEPKQRGKKKRSDPATTKVARECAMKKQKPGKNNSQNTTEDYTTDIDGNTVVRSNVDALNLNISVLDNENISQPITKSLHDDPYTIDNPIIRDHLLEGDRGKLSQPDPERKIENQDSNTKQLVSNQISELTLNDLETGVTDKNLENLNKPGLLAEIDDFEAITKTTAKMPVEDKSCGERSTDEHKASHKSDQGTDGLEDGKKIINEAILDLGLEFMFPRQKNPQPVTRENRKIKTVNVWSQELIDKYIQTMSQVRINLNTDIYKFMLSYDPSQVEYALNQMSLRSDHVFNPNAYFTRTVETAPISRLGSPVPIYDHEQRERDRKLEEEMMNQENVTARSKQLFPGIREAIAKGKMKSSLLLNNKQNPLDYAKIEAELIQKHGWSASAAYEEVMRIKADNETRSRS